MLDLGMGKVVGAPADGELSGTWVRSLDFCLKEKYKATERFQ